MKPAQTIDGSCHCGELQWHFDGPISSATACNCTVCRRYGVLWAYDYEGERIRVNGKSQAYVRGDESLEFHFCPHCACVAFWRSRESQPDGRRRIAVNVRMAGPAVVADIPIDHFDGLDTFKDLPRDGRCVVDYWF